MNAEFLAEYVHGRRTLREYFDRLVAEPAFAAAFEGCPEMGVRCAAHLWEALSNLDAIPRTDPFWSGSNMRATFTKVREYDLKTEGSQAQAIDLSWRSFVIAAFAGDVDRFGRTSELLIRAGAMRPTEFVRLALNQASVSGELTDELAAEMLMRLKVTDVARESLNAIARSGSSHATDWASKVLGRVSAG
jgi:hypothetical protein